MSSTILTNELPSLTVTAIDPSNADSCFVYGTKVWLAEGKTMEIQDTTTIGTQLAWAKSLTEVKLGISHPSISTQTETLVCTPNQRFAVLGADASTVSWKHAKELRSSDRLVTAHENIVSIQVTQVGSCRRALRMPGVSGQVVYSFQAGDLQNYFVGEKAKVLVR